MQLCLGYPTHGYYMKGDPLGVAGDFITSPEITQVFGELTAIWFISALQATVPLSSPPSGGGIRKLRLVELGPGRGTLSSDILRVLTGPLASRSGLPPVTNVHLVETSLALRAKQERILEQYTHNASSTTSSGSIDPLSIEWHDHIDDVPVDVGPETHTLVVANEFFDALPINVFEKAADGWREVLVDENTQSNVLRPSEVPVSSRTDTSSTSIASTLHSPPRLRFIVSNQPLPVPALATNPRFLNLPVGTRVEYSRGGVGTMRSLARLIGGSGSGGGRGLGLIIDYGDDRFFSSSFRGIRNHRIVDPFDQPGNSDLTANVDFATLKDAIGDVTNGM
ncbi:hypothetical protein FRC17_007186 [Serendipita sp. 399]|nr:hypothetical protein FRC17_007186 [Serendipita sp. 399]